MAEVAKPDFAMSGWDDADPAGPAAITPDDSPMSFEDARSSPQLTDLRTPEVAVGDRAPDFSLPRLGDPADEVRLGDFAGHQPVALIFGSYT